jgi:hypothetical protein
VFWVYASCTAAMLTASLASAGDKPPPVDFDRLEGGETVVFKSESGSPPKQFKPGWADLAYVGILNPGNGATPYFLFSGRPCQNCPNDKALLLLRPPTGSSVPQLTSFVYPGKLFEARSRALALDSRAFFGRCLPGRRDVYVAFQKERVDRRSKLQNSVLVAEADGEHLQEQLIERNLPRIETTLKLVRSKSCREIEGRNRVAPRIALGAASSKLPTEEEVDDDAATDEEGAPIVGPSPSPTPTH